MGNSNLIDKESALARLGGNEGLYNVLLGKFKASIDMDGFDKAISSGDYVEAGNIAHAAKGVAGNLSLTAFFEQSVVVMDQMRSDDYNEDDVNEFRRLFDETNKAIDELIK